MTAHATAPSGAARSEFIPYVYGAAVGRPSKGRPEKVLAYANRAENAMRATTREQEEKVGNGRIDGHEGRVTARNAVPGGPTRNGLPEPRGYVYRGTGKDTLTPPSVMAEWARKEERRQDCCAAPKPDHFSSCETAAALLAGLEKAGGLMAPTQALSPRRAAPRPERPQARTPDNQPDKRAPEIGSSQAGDTGRPDSPADNEPEPAAAPEPGALQAPEPARLLEAAPAAVPKPARRHRKCGYPVDSIGHKTVCGDGK